MGDGVPLARTSSVGLRWGLFLGEIGEVLDPTWDPWRTYPLDLEARSGLPDFGHGPAIYACLGHGAWQYVGQTSQPVAARLRGHGNDGNAVRRAAKRTTWGSVCVAVLDPRCAAEMDRVERLAHDVLRPRMGSRWPAPAGHIQRGHRGGATVT